MAMAATKAIAGQAWTLRWAAIFAAGCFLAGIGGGWLLREVQGGPATQAHAARAASTPRSGIAQTNGSVDGAAAPLLQRLQSDPNNPDLLISLGNLYYDAQQYPAAVGYYGRALHLRPSDADVRTDMGTAYWYMGDAERAIAEFSQALTDHPNNPNTLFNRGLVKLQGKKDSRGAIADWQQLLATAPDYADRDKVEQMIAEASKQSKL
jgi:cytochrome c-type biogenesis protein CcmH/NrfG